EVVLDGTPNHRGLGERLGEDAGGRCSKVDRQRHFEGDAGSPGCLGHAEREPTTPCEQIDDGQRAVSAFVLRTLAGPEELEVLVHSPPTTSFSQRAGAYAACATAPTTFHS